MTDDVWTRNRVNYHHGPVAIDIQTGVGGLGGKLQGQAFAKAKQHSQICILAESKLNTIANHISAALNSDMISNKDFN